ncbi:MAG TPA: PP2C family protein-serine/threonine phosphatase [Acidimicrobiales bacterium]|nr:PP2C family protein-serine/threonine phosphatase [Acidimicrobiales bacterium]
MDGLDFTTLIQTLEDTAPFELVPALEAHLEASFARSRLTFWIADYGGYTLERLDHTRPRCSLSIASSDAGRALRTQILEVLATAEGTRVFVPVTARGEAIGVLEIDLAAEPNPDQRSHLRSLGHAFAYVVAGTRRHTDLFEWGQRSHDLNVAAEIQRRLLPAFACETGRLTLAGWVEPAFEAGGDTFDYTVDKASTLVSLTDAMGHGVGAALLATLAIGVLRNARRRSVSLAEQVAMANRVLSGLAGGEQYVTGVFVDVPSDGGSATAISAGHPPPWRLRSGRAEPLVIQPAPPLGMFENSRYEISALDFTPGDRLVLVSDGIIDTLEASGLGVGDLLADTQDLHPREVVRKLTSTVTALRDGKLRDDATAVCIDWHSRGENRQSAAGADIARASLSLT